MHMTPQATMFTIIYPEGYMLNSQVLCLNIYIIHEYRDIFEQLQNMVL
jgi:hypothetical protein